MKVAGRLGRGPVNSTINRTARPATGLLKSAALKLPPARFRGMHPGAL